MFQVDPINFIFDYYGRTDSLKKRKMTEALSWKIESQKKENKHVELQKKDLSRLDGKNWLNDIIILDYLKVRNE